MFAQDSDPKGKEIKIKRTQKNMSDMRYLIYLGINGRTFVFSAHNPADQRMWLSAFEVYFQLKFIADCVKNNKPIPKNLLKENQPKPKTLN